MEAKLKSIYSFLLDNRSYNKELQEKEYRKINKEKISTLNKKWREDNKEELYKKQERIDAIINFSIGSILFVLGGGLLLLVFYFIGKQQGRW